ncbi:uncharacterized protein LOC131626613 [Vicia villosa]|uniref:uncharacterized protein LOC131626613 n=1 Tax=Vicia villosa TaxID=3911 RepID=UPI00273C511B|nr:uncharacterized protein LOC131626613 [Vicia villosa]
MLAGEADNWWLETRQQLETIGDVITWAIFSREFMRKYYPEDVHGKKEIEFLELKQGDLLVTDYAAKFVELAKFYPHYNEATAEFSKCIKLESGLRPEIKKILNEKRGKHQQNCGKPYDAPVGKGKQKTIDGQITSGGDAHTGIVCFMYGKPGHMSKACTTEVKRCFRRGKVGHTVAECKHKEVLCFNYDEEGHIGSQCQKPKLTQAGGKMFALARTQIANEDRLIIGTCFIDNTPIITIIDTGATYCFIVADCVKRLGHVLSSMNGEMVIDTPANGSVNTYLVCLKCHLSMFDRDVALDIICLPLSGLDVILGMNMLESNYVHINCYKKSVRFSTPNEGKETEFLSARQLNELMKDKSQVFALMASLSVENQAAIYELPVVREFPKVFPNEIPDVPPKKEVEFAIDLVPKVSLIRIA